ncbi:trypsin-like peptidase domain-containing protein [Sporosarcina sp. JAI121]|uniref:trypsin-like peptidase domain-containing protein n=1 Tax=Sporosarcina sp. JAI121 TaxID=2723064 RepID=UPI0015CCC23F|nr:trypsin-like peptidase domain-containing protein [Sporosarcina sp. JAI121]NYF23580.1 S1-C subfamily serine protease [Sporosarcina sp. JAI121]
MFCQKCGGKNEANAQFCGSCGTPLKKSGSSTGRVWLWIGIFVSIFVMAGVGYTLVQVLNEKKPSEVVESVVAEEPEEVKQVKKPVEKAVVQPVVQKAKSLEKEKTAVIKDSLPKVYTIFTQDGLGSGFLYKKGGLIVTNAHVVAGYSDVIVRNSNGKDTHGQVIGISDRYDVALIRVADYANVEPLSVEKNESMIGTEVIALGSPQGFENSASVGYLTGINRNIDFDFSYENVYQVDAQIDQGSSGGPLLDAKTGKVIGINSLLYTNKNNFAFSIPMYSMVDLLDSWAQSPMTTNQVAGAFDFYDDYIDDSASTEAESYYEDYVEEQEVNANASFNEATLESFILEFRDYYALALKDEDFYWIQDMLMPGGAAYNELEDYVAEIAGQGMTFDFKNNAVTGIEIHDQFATVSTLEQFDFTTAAGELIYYEREKDYTVIIDESGYYRISDIFIYQ